MSRLTKVTFGFVLFFMLFTVIAFYETFTMYGIHGLNWTITVDGVVSHENIWSYVGSCIFSCLILLVLIANLDRIKQLEKIIKDMDL